MNTFCRLGSAAVLAVATVFGAHATTLDITAQPNQWHAFDIDDLSATSGGIEWIDLDASFGDPLSFTFTVAAGSRTALRIVDAGFAGDRFAIHLFDGTSTLEFQTGATVDSYPASVANDYDAAWADPDYSRFVSLELAPGWYTVTGELLLSADSGAPLNVTTGALMLTVPEPGGLPLAALGFALLGAFARRRA